MTINNCVGGVNIEMKCKILYYPASMNEHFVTNLTPSIYSPPLIHFLIKNKSALFDLCQKLLLNRNNDER